MIDDLPVRRNVLLVVSSYRWLCARAAHIWMSIPHPPSPHTVMDILFAPSISAACPIARALLLIDLLMGESQAEGSMDCDRYQMLLESKAQKLFDRFRVLSLL